MYKKITKEPLKVFPVLITKDAEKELKAGLFWVNFNFALTLVAKTSIMKTPHSKKGEIASPKIKITKSTY